MKQRTRISLDARGQSKAPMTRQDAALVVRYALPPASLNMKSKRTLSRLMCVMISGAFTTKKAMQILLNTTLLEPKLNAMW